MYHEIIAGNYKSSRHNGPSIVVVGGPDGKKLFVPVVVVCWELGNIIARLCDWNISGQPIIQEAELANQPAVHILSS